MTSPKTPLPRTTAAFDAAVAVIADRSDSDLQSAFYHASILLEGWLLRELNDLCHHMHRPPPLEDPHFDAAGTYLHSLRSVQNANDGLRYLASCEVVSHQIRHHNDLLLTAADSVLSRAPVVPVNRKLFLRPVSAPPSTNRSN